MIAMPDKVKSLLDASVRRVRRIYLLRGIAATLAVAIAATLAAMSVDACFTLYSDAARWLLSAALYACVFAAAWLFFPGFMSMPTPRPTASPAPIPFQNPEPIRRSLLFRI